MHGVVTRFLQTYRGSSFPTLAELADGQQVIVKLRGAGNGAEALLGEFVVNRLAHLAGLPVPDALIVELPAGFPWQYGTDEFHDLVIKSPGANLGLVVIPHARPLSLDQYAALPAHFVSQVVTLDRTFANWDRTNPSGNLLAGDRGQPWMVDHGSCRFLHEGRPASLAPLPSNHSFANRSDTFDATWLEMLDAEAVRAVATGVPHTWLVETQRTREEIVEVVCHRINLARRHLP